MGGIGRCFRILLDYLMNLVWMGGCSLQRRVIDELLFFAGKKRQCSRVQMNTPTGQKTKVG